MIKKVIIPVAGLGTRFLPATKAQPKEMLSIVDKPVIQYLVEEAVASGITDVIFVTGRSKRAIEDHFDYAPELELELARRGKDGLLEAVRKISEMARFAYVRQKTPRGDGDAILAAEHLIGNEPVAVLFGDDIIDNDPPCLLQLMEVFEKYHDPVIALEELPMREVSKYGVIDPVKVEARVFQIKDLVEKPSRDKAPSRLTIVGKYIITPAVFRELRRIKKPKGEELRLADAFRNLCKRQAVYGLKFDGVRYDCGSKIGFLKATVEFGLRHKETRKEFMVYLRRVGRNL